MRIDIKDVHKKFDAFPALRGLDLSVADGELVALLGPSGSGKTTLLRVIAGLENPERGQILFNGVNMAGTPVQKRNVGFVFQHYALFRHLRIWENVAFGLKVLPWKDRPNRAARRKKALDLLDLVQLDGLAERFPAQLSGGQRQRVALARALCTDPAALLLDEPFGALDAKVRRELRRWLRDLHDKTGHTTLFVTHDQEEALELADRVVVMNDGRIEQTGTPEELYQSPASGFVYGFLGDTNALDVTIRDGSVYLDGCPEPLVGQTALDDGPARLFVRPNDLQITTTPQSGSVSGSVRAIRRRLDSLRIEVELDGYGALLEAAMNDSTVAVPPAIDSMVWLTVGRHGLFRSLNTTDALGEGEVV